VAPDEIRQVTMLGVDGPLSWRFDNDEGLIIQMPPKMPGEYANTLKIEMEPVVLLIPVVEDVA
jgi:hypothetical protein